MVGDMAESFIKRQCGLARGASTPLLDQLDYIVGAFLFASLATPFLLKRFATVALITVPLHYTANFVAYKLKLKDVWW
jgi:CDP-2,3-bis-(O-geranylgeranyl)-sn-glycerol synthase